MIYCGKSKNEIIADLYSMEDSAFFESYFNTNEAWYFNHLVSRNREPAKYVPKLAFIMDKHFNVGNKDFLIVGSAKLGFSLSPRKKLKVFTPFHDDLRVQSDIDIAIISSELFDDLWEGLKELKYRTHINRYPDISSNIFRGFVNDKNIFEQISITSRVIDMMDSCTTALRDDFGVTQQINYRFYHSWIDLERYTRDGIVKCKGERHGI